MDCIFEKCTVKLIFLQKRAFHSRQKVALSSSENGSSSTEETLGERVSAKPSKYTKILSRPQCLLCCWVDSLYYQLHLFLYKCILIQWPMVSFQFVTGKKKTTQYLAGYLWEWGVSAGKHICCAFFLFSMRLNSSCHLKSCITAAA